MLFPLVIGIEINGTDEPMFEFSILLFIGYFLIFATFIKLPWFFYSNGFIEPNPIFKHLIKKNQIFIHYNLITSVEFESLSDYGYDHFLVDNKEWNKNINERIYKSNIYRDSRIKQKVIVRTSDGESYPLSLNLFEEIYDVLKKNIGDNWQDDWYMPSNDNKVYFPEKGLDHDYP